MPDPEVSGGGLLNLALKETFERARGPSSPTRSSAPPVGVFRAGTRVGLRDDSTKKHDAPDYSARHRVRRLSRYPPARSLGVHICFMVNLEKGVRLAE